MISPFKAAIGGDYRRIEGRLQQAIHIRFGLPAAADGSCKQIKAVDRLSAYIEATALAGYHDRRSAQTFRQAGEPGQENSPRLSNPCGRRRWSGAFSIVSRNSTPPRRSPRESRRQGEACRAAPSCLLALADRGNGRPHRRAVPRHASEPRRGLGRPTQSSRNGISTLPCQTSRCRARPDSARSQAPQPLPRLPPRVGRDEPMVIHCYAGVAARRRGLHRGLRA